MYRKLISYRHMANPLTPSIRHFSLFKPQNSNDDKKPNSPKGHIANFWNDRATWIKTSKNTFNCLMGCNIGDYGMIVALNYYYPDLSFHVVMPIAMTSGLFTSVLLESTILRYKENLTWRQSVKVATSMSFASMLAMESAENITDYLLTGGQAKIHELWFWQALGISTGAGFFVPLPYNYYQLKKHGKSCHQQTDKTHRLEDKACEHSMKFRR